MTSSWSGEERRQGPNPEALQNELRAVRQDVGRLASSVATLGSDERMQEVIDSVLEEENRHRQRILTKIVIGLIVIGMIGLFQLTLTSAVRDTTVKTREAAESAGKVAMYVDHCLVHPDQATPGECGNTTATGQQSAAILALFCYLQLPQDKRNEVTARDCFTKATAQAKTQTSSTTVTR